MKTLFTMDDFSGPDEGTSASFKCSTGNKGAFLSIPFNGVERTLFA